MFAPSHTGQGRHGFSLASGGDNEDLMIRELFNLSFAYFTIFRYMNKPLLFGNPHVRDHAFPVENYLATEFYSQGYHLLDAGNIRCKAGNHESSPAGLKQVI